MYKHFSRDAGVTDGDHWAILGYAGLHFLAGLLRGQLSECLYLSPAPGPFHRFSPILLPPLPGAHPGL